MVRVMLVVAAEIRAIAIAPAADPAVSFIDVTAGSGITFVHNNGAFGKKYLPETIGSGALFLDVDGDGWQDVLLINSTNWRGHPGARSAPALDRNPHHRTFADITRGSRLDLRLDGIRAGP